MDKFLRVTDERPARQSRRGNVRTHRDVTAERIEKLKKNFQPFWMRGMIPHDKDADEQLNGMDYLNQI
jgi:hypothetical protein